MSTSKEMCALRLSEVIRLSNMSPNAFALHIGLKNSENLYRVLKLKNGISKKLADTIAESFPQINPEWLRCGEGEMIVKDNRQIDYYDLDAESNIADVEKRSPTQKITLPVGKECDFAVKYNGAAMGSTIPAGSTVMLKRIEVDAIIPGKEYLVESSNVTTLRVVRAPIVNDPNNPTWRLVAADNERFDDIEVARESIVRVYLVVAKLIINY